MIIVFGGQQPSSSQPFVHDPGRHGCTDGHRVHLQATHDWTHNDTAVTRNVRIQFIVWNESRFGWPLVPQYYRMPQNPPPPSIASCYRGGGLRRWRLRTNIGNHSYLSLFFSSFPLVSSLSPSVPFQKWEQYWKDIRHEMPPGAMSMVFPWIIT